MKRLSWVNGFLRRIYDQKYVVPMVRKYELVRSRDGRVIVAGWSHNVCTFAMTCYRNNEVLFGDTDIARTESQKKALLERKEKEGSVDMHFRVAGTSSRLEIKHRNGKCFLVDLEDAKGFDQNLWHIHCNVPDCLQS